MLQFLRITIFELTMMEQYSQSKFNVYPCLKDDLICDYKYCIKEHKTRQKCSHPINCNNSKCTMGHYKEDRDYRQAYKPIFANQNDDEETIKKLLESRSILKIDENFVYYEYSSSNNMSKPVPNSMQNSRSPRSKLVLPPPQDRTRSSSVDRSPMSPNIKGSMCIPSSFIKVPPDGNNSVSKSDIKQTNVIWNDYTNGVWTLGELCSCEYCTSKLTGIKGDVISTRLFVGEHDMAGALAYTMNHRRPGERLIATDLIGVDRPTSVIEKGYQNWLKTLIIHDIEVHLGVDMRQLDNYFSNSMHIRHIQCNRPYTYSKAAERKEFADPSLTNRSLLMGLFESGRKLQEVNDTIAISIDENGVKPSESRQAEVNIVHASIKNGYRLVQIRPLTPSYRTDNPGTNGTPEDKIQEFLFVKTEIDNFPFELDRRLKAILDTEAFKWKINETGADEWLETNKTRNGFQLVTDQLNFWLCKSLNQNSYQVILVKNDVPEAKGPNMKSYLGFAYTSKSDKK